VKAGFGTAPPVSTRLVKWGRMYGPSGRRFHCVEDMWSSAVRVALRSPPTMLREDGRDGKEVQKGRWTVLSAGAYTLRTFICGEWDGVMVMSRMRGSFDSKVSEDLM